VLIGGGAFLLVLAAATVDAYVQAYSSVNDLREVADGLAGARNALGRGEMPNGDPFGKALDATERIRADLAHARPTFGFVGAIPFLGRPVVAVRQLALASEEEARAAVAARDLIDDMSGGAFSASGGGSGEGDRTRCADEPTKEAKQACKEARDNGSQDQRAGTQSPLFADGRFDLAALESFRPRVQEVVDRLAAAGRAVEAVPTAPFISKATQLKRGLLAEVRQAERVGNSALRGMRCCPACSATTVPGGTSWRSATCRTSAGPAARRWPTPSSRPTTGPSRSRSPSRCSGISTTRPTSRWRSRRTTGT